jgi:ferritin-like metal-binding protein YciE
LEIRVNIEHEIRVLQALVRDHRTETEAQARALREAIELSIANAVRLEIGQELATEHPELAEEIREWLARHGLELVGE